MSIVDKFTAQTLLWACGILAALCLVLGIATTVQTLRLDTAQAKVASCDTATQNAAAANDAQESVIASLRLQVAELGYRNVIDRQTGLDMLADRQASAEARQASLEARIDELEAIADPTGCADRPIGQEFERAVRQ